MTIFIRDEVAQRFGYRKEKGQMNIIDELTWRGAINQQTDAEGLKKLTSDKKISLYCGVDPTGDSMHIGHLIPFMMMKRFELMGHHPYILIGGATGSIGDPSGRKTERQLQTMEKVQHNVKALSRQMQRLFGGDSNVTMVNNYDWLSKISLLDFLRDYGKLVNVNTMLAKDIVASRLDNGISFTEFTYQILQSVDFLTLNRDHNIQLQIGGADQWGNITAGIDLIHKVTGSETEVYGLTIPLMLKADGTKFGKTAGGAIWLDAEKTSPYEFYQFWLNQDDRDVIRYLKFFTFLGQDEIAELAQSVEDAPEKRVAQRRLAEEVTRFVHGEESLESAQHISEILFSGDIQKLTVTEVQEAFEKVPNVTIAATPKNIVDVLVETEIEPSKRQAREDVTNGAITINGERQTDTTVELDPAKHFSGKFMVIRRGKKNYFLARVAH
ncbi:tyrosyl-tRNA synthetase [Levilactobacillus acidifarinae DSM 19394]|uniref:Tyrosine--tRNA ligase n=2 Tax=Levilactobacillus acidifarinae TaxID=267364 RepID=A0A0R1LJK2_9LACO|nr:tyrosyl-tRNA synthetase [Levilactobacillus acidifarinae DSM 19394]